MPGFGQCQGDPREAQAERKAGYKFKQVRSHQSGRQRDRASRC